MDTDELIIETQNAPMTFQAPMTLQAPPMPTLPASMPTFQAPMTFQATMPTLQDPMTFQAPMPTLQAPMPTYQSVPTPAPMPTYQSVPTPAPYIYQSYKPRPPAPLILKQILTTISDYKSFLYQCFTDSKKFSFIVHLICDIILFYLIFSYIHNQFLITEILINETKDRLKEIKLKNRLY
jgi:hypothetical protein